MGRQLLETLLAMMEISMLLMAVPRAAIFDMAFSLVTPAVGLVMAVALVANLGPVGVLFAFKGAMPKLENVSPAK